MLIGVMAQPILAGHKDHCCGSNLSHEGCIMVRPAHHALGSGSQCIRRLLNGIQDLGRSKQSAPGQQAAQKLPLTEMLKVIP